MRCRREGTYCQCGFGKCEKAEFSLGKPTEVTFQPAKTPRETLTDDVLTALSKFERATGVRVTWLQVAHLTEGGRFDPKSGARTVSLKRVSPSSLPDID